MQQTSAHGQMIAVCDTALNCQVVHIDSNVVDYTSA